MTIVYNEPCGETVEPTETETETESTGGGNANNPPAPPVPPPPEFLAPDNHISKVVLTADREINIIPRQYFLQPADIKKYFNSLAEDPANRQQRINLFPENVGSPNLANVRLLVDNLRLDTQAIWIWDQFFANESLLKDTIEDTYYFYGISESLYNTASPVKPKVIFSQTDMGPFMDLKSQFEIRSPTSEDGLGVALFSSYFGPGFVQDSKVFLDHTFAAKQPFFLDELNYLEASRFISVDIDTYSANYVEYSNDLKETDKTSLYRLYTQKKNPSDSGLSDLETFLGPQDFCKFEDKVQKFTCGAIAEMAEANKNMVGSFDHYVKITINTNQSSKLAEFFDEYNMDKYFLELYTSPQQMNFRLGPDVEDEALLGPTQPEQEESPEPPQSEQGNSSPFSRLSTGERIDTGGQLQEAGESLTGSATQSDQMLTLLGLPMQVAQIQDEDIVEKDENLRATFYENDRAEITTVEYLDGIVDFIEDIKNKDFDFFDRGIRKQDYPIPFEFGKLTESNTLRFTDTIRSQIFMSKFREQILTRDNIRNIEEILKGKKSYSQIIGYRVAKHEVIPSQNSLDANQPGKMIQEFLFADSNDVRTIDFIDTQVFPGKSYIYRIYSINFVIGSEYTYKQTDPGEIEIVGRNPRTDAPFYRYSSSYEATTLPSCRIIEAPFFEKEVFMADKPPIFPQVNFVPNQGVANKMNILLLQNTDEIEEVPVEVLETDSEHITNMINASRTTVKKDGTVLYGTDTLPEFFEVFRLSTPPENYKSFAEPELYRKLKATGKSVFFEDTDFEKNTDYYYMFRTIDKAGISNPTRVFRVKMVEYQSGIFMDLELYDFPTTEEQYSMDFTRALQICPAMTQKSLKVNPNLNVDSFEFFESAPDIEDIDIGNELDNPVWNNQYRMRITSKTSGRKININFKFKKNKKVLSKLKDPEPIQSPDNEEPCSEGQSLTPATSASTESAKGPSQVYTGPQEGEPFY